MSTLPGDDAERDAGLVAPDLDQPVNLTEEVEVQRVDPEAAPSEHERDEHRPGPARPDLDGEADEADVLDQLAEEPVDDRGEI